MNRLFSSALKNLDSEKPQTTTQNSKLYSEQITNSIQRVPQFGQVISQEKKNSQNSRNQKTIKESSYKMRAFSPEDKQNHSLRLNHQKNQDQSKPEKIINLKSQEPMKLQGKSIKIKKLEIIRSQINDNNSQYQKQQQQQNKNTQKNINQQHSNSNSNSHLQIIKDTHTQNLLSQHLVFVRNVSQKASEQDFKSLLRKMHIIDIRISKSTAEIIIQGLDDAEKAIKILQQTQLHGQNLKAVLQEEVNKGLSHNKPKKVINESKGHIINI